MTDKTDILSNLKQIENLNESGSWLNRIANTMRFRKKQAMVHPCVIDGYQTLVYERGLAISDPRSFSLLQEFANGSGYKLKEDQRSDFMEGVKRVKNAKHANVISIMVLTASLMSTQTVYAKSGHKDHNPFSHFIPDSAHTQVEEGFDFDLDSFKTQEDLASGLISWINSHSSFDYDIDKIPDIKKVSAKQIAEVAFGGRLPKAVNPKNLNILGLYNFNEKAVYLLDSIDLDTDKGKAILLHELVHFLQYQTGVNKDVRCMNELETLAYTLEAKFLEAHDHKHNISQSHINKVSQCRSA